MTDTKETNKFNEIKYLRNLLNINQEMVEEYSKCIREQQKTIESLTDMVDELKAQIEKMKCCQNCERNCAHMYGEGCWKCGIPTNWRLKIR